LAVPSWEIISCIQHNDQPTASDTNIPAAEDVAANVSITDDEKLKHSLNLFAEAGTAAAYRRLRSIVNRMVRKDYPSGLVLPFERLEELHTYGVLTRQQIVRPPVWICGTSFSADRVVSKKVAPFQETQFLEKLDDLMKQGKVEKFHSNRKTFFIGCSTPGTAEDVGNELQIRKVQPFSRCISWTATANMVKRWLQLDQNSPSVPCIGFFDGYSGNGFRRSSTCLMFSRLDIDLNGKNHSEGSF